jgi:ribonuclease G
MDMDMAKKVYVVNYENPELRIAEIRNGKLHDLDTERLHGELGSIFYAKIANVLSGMEAAFVDIGGKKNGLLHFKDIHWLPSGKQWVLGSQPLQPITIGKHLVVQAARPGVGNKGPRLTTRISLPGRYIVLVFPSDTVGVSRKIESESERNRLRNISEKIRPLDCGIIVRTEAEGASSDALEEDLQDLQKQLENLKLRSTEDSSPKCIHQDLGILGKLVRDRLSHDTEAVYIDDYFQFQACLALVQDFAPELAGKIQHFAEKRSIFEAFNVQKDIQKSLSNTVNLQHGGTLIIEETEALTVIDVNTSRFVGKDHVAETILQTNLDAVEEAALQLRLRNIGGIIVIDFIDMERTRDRIQVLNALENALKADRVKTHIVQLSPSGLVEITRRREGLTLRAETHEPCQVCHGFGTLKTPETSAIETRRRLRVLVKEAGQIFSITTHPEVATAILGHNAQYIHELEDSTGGYFLIRVDETMHRESVQIEPALPGLMAEKNVSERCTIGVHDGLYPASSPEYAVWENRLVKIPDAVPIADSAPYINEVVVLEIIHVSRWFATARMVRGVPSS